MKKFKLIFLTVFLTLLLGGCGAQNKQATQTSGGEQNQVQDQTQQQEQQQEQVEAGDQNYSGTLEKIMGLGVPLKCEWKKDNTYYGTAWVKGEKSYSEVSAQGQTNNVIVKDDCMWTWQEGNAQGFKMCFEPVEEQEVPDVGQQQGQGQMNMNQMKPPEDLNYSCQPAVFTDSKFDAPADVEFMSLEDMMSGQGM